MAEINAKPSASRNQPPASRPTTPLRPSSRTSLRNTRSLPTSNGGQSNLPLETIEPAFAELSDSMADLEANFMHLQLMHESLSRFSESFASFLYGLNMNAFCVDFPEAPTSDSFRRMGHESEHVDTETPTEPDRSRLGHDAETNLLANDTSITDKAPTSSRGSLKTVTPTPVFPPAPPSSRGSAVGKGGATRGSGRLARGSGLPTAKMRASR